MNWRRRAYEGILRGYAYDFGMKHGFLEKGDSLPRDCMNYGFVEFADMYFDINDIIYDIDHRIPKGKIIEWYDYNLEMLMDGYKSVNYQSYLKGFRHVKRSLLKEFLYRAKKKLSRLSRKPLTRKEKKIIKQRFIKMMDFKNMF